MGFGMKGQNEKQGDFLAVFLYFFPVPERVMFGRKNLRL